MKPTDASAPSGSTTGTDSGRANGLPHSLVVRDPAIFSGAPILIGTRFPVHDVVNELRHYDGDVERVVADHPQLSTELVQAAMAYYQEHTEEIEQLLEERQEYFTTLLAVEPRT
jgi:uncharacterized protein (DUF433 family)